MMEPLADPAEPAGERPFPGNSSNIYQAHGGDTHVLAHGCARMWKPLWLAKVGFAGMDHSPTWGGGDGPFGVGLW